MQNTRVPRFCVGLRLVAILLNTYGEENVLSPSAITTVSWPAFTTPDPSIALDSAPVYNDAAVLARAIRRAANINQLIILTYCLKILIFYHTKILRYPKTIIIIL